jgi:hypothetical protein
MHYFVWQLFWLLFKKIGQIFSKSSGHPAATLLLMTSRQIN